MPRMPARPSHNIGRTAMSGTQTLKVDFLLQELSNLEWDTLGTYLGLSQSDIREIEHDYQSTSRRRIVMLDTWLRKEESPSWMKIITALEKMSKKNLASQLRKKYLQQDNAENAATAHSCAGECTREERPDYLQQATVTLKVDRKDPVAKKLESIKEIFVRLVMSAESALETANPSSRQLKRFSQQYISDRVVSSVEELFDCLGELSFLDYALLEHTISMFLKETHPITSDLSDYIQQLNDFKKSTTLKEFMETIETAQGSVEGTDACTVTLRLVGGWLEKTMGDLDKLLKEIFQDKSSVLTNLKIVRGSVIVSYLAPQFQTRSLLKVTKTKLLFMSRIGVCKVIIGQTTFITRQNELRKFSFESSLINAVIKKRIKRLTFLLHINTSPDTVDAHGQTALMFGSCFGHNKVVSILLQAKANPNIQRNDGVTALFMATQNGHSDTVGILLQANADPNPQRVDGVTPLYMAVQNSDLDTVSILLQMNANPNIRRNDGVTPLSIAVQNGHFDIVSILLQSNADPNLQKQNGDTPLIMAAQNNHFDIVSILLQANSNPNFQKKNGVTALYMAAQNGHQFTVRILLQANANPNLQRDDGATPLFMAAQNDHSNTVRILLQANAYPDLQRYDGTTPLMIACLNSYPQIVGLLLTNGANPNVQSSNGITALMCACRTGCLKSTKLLLKAGADPDIMNLGGITAVDIAVFKGHNDIADIVKRK